MCARPRPLTPGAVVSELAERIAAVPVRGTATRVLLDGAPPSDPAGWAQALVEPLRILGRPVLRVTAEDFLRPASLRWENGRTDPDAFYAERLDVGALRRELLAPLGPGGSGQVLSRWWDAVTDRSARAEYVTPPDGTVLLLDGTLLLGLGLPADLEVHLHLTPAALQRRTEPELAWTLPAYGRYAAEVDPEAVADVVVRVDHPGRPAMQAR